MLLSLGSRFNLVLQPIVRKLLFASRQCAPSHGQSHDGGYEIETYASFYLSVA